MYESTVINFFTIFIIFNLSINSNICLISGVLVVNVTWRGKTYVGTLLDATKHDWAPPRYC